jgi:hypothetical protein
LGSCSPTNFLIFEGIKCLFHIFCSPIIQLQLTWAFCYFVLLMMINWYEVKILIFLKGKEIQRKYNSYKTLTIHDQIKFSHEIISISISNRIWNLIFIYWKHGYFFDILNIPQCLT